MSLLRFLRLLGTTACLLAAGLPPLAASQLICTVGSSGDAGAVPADPGQALLPPEGGLTVLRAADGTIVKFGDPDSFHDPTVMNVYWFDESGSRLLSSLTKRFAPGGFVALTQHGRAAVAAPTLRNPKQWTVGLYESQKGGRSVWFDKLDPTRRVADVAVSPSGDAIAVLTTDVANWLDDHRVVVYRGQKPVPEVSGVGTVQHTVFVTPPGAMRGFLFVQGTTGYALSDLSDDGWLQDGRVRLASSSSVTLADGGPNAAVVLIALEAEEDDSPEDLYEWRLVALQSSDGAVLGRCPLGDRPTKWLPSRLVASRDRVLVVVRGNEISEVKWGLR